MIKQDIENIMEVLIEFLKWDLLVIFRYIGPQCCEGDIWHQTMNGVYLWG